MVNAQTTSSAALLLPLLENENESLANTSSTHNNILSLELRANFDALRSLQQCNNIANSNNEDRPHKRRNLGNNLNLSDDDDDTLAVSSEDSSNDVFRLATTTYFMIEDEISRMVNGIAELEALLLKQNEDNIDDENKNDFVVEQEQYQQQQHSNNLDISAAAVSDSEES